MLQGGKQRSAYNTISFQSEPEPEPEKVLPPPARSQGGKQRSAYSTNAAPSLEEKQRLMHEAMGTMGRPKKSPGKTAGGGGGKKQTAPPSMQEKQRLMMQVRLPFPVLCWRTGLSSAVPDCGDCPRLNTIDT